MPVGKRLCQAFPFCQKARACEPARLEACGGGVKLAQPRSVVKRPPPGFASTQSFRQPERVEVLGHAALILTRRPAVDQRFLVNMPTTASTMMAPMIEPIQPTPSPGS